MVKVISNGNGRPRESTPPSNFYTHSELRNIFFRDAPAKTMEKEISALSHLSSFKMLLSGEYIISCIIGDN